MRRPAAKPGGQLAGPILAGAFHNQAVNIIALAGVFMLLGAVSVFFVVEHQAEEAGIERDAVAA